MTLLQLLQIEQFVVASCLLLVIVSAGVRAARLRRTGTLRLRGQPLVFWGLLALGLAARLAVEPALLHTNFHGYGVLENALAFPRAGTFRASYGQTSFFIQGLVSAVTGGSVEALIAIDALANVFIVAVGASLAGRIAGPTARDVTAAAGVLLPLLVRVGASEDAHNLAVAFGMTAFLWADTYRRAGGSTWADGAGIVAAAVLAALGRQSLFLWAPLVLAGAFAGRWRALYRRPGVLVAVAAFLGLVAPHLVVMSYEEGDSVSYLAYLIGPLFLLEWTVLLNHPLFWIEGTWVLLLFLAAYVVMFRLRGDAAEVLLAAWAAVMFLATFAVSAAPLWNDGLYQRLSLFALLLPLAGVGAARAAARLGARFRPAVGNVAVLLALVGPVAGYAALYDEPDPVYAEYRLLRARAPELAPGVVRFPSYRGREPSYRIPPGLFEHGPVRAAVAGRPAPALGREYFLEGLACYAWAPEELCHLPASDDWDELRKRVGLEGLSQLPALAAELVRDPIGWMARQGCELPRGPRPECVEWMTGRSVRWGEVRVVRQQIPVVYYSAEVVPIRVWMVDR